ncbi:MAG: hypothetical protein DME26_14315, partial [Verrucomicrobia bacterium]
NFFNVTAEFSLTDGADSPDVAADGSVWFGLGSSVWRYLPNAAKRGMKNQFDSFSGTDGLLRANVFSTYGKSQTDLWVATGGGASHFDGRSFVNFTKADGLAQNDVITITGTPDGTIWFGTRSGGISRYEPNVISHFTQADGMTFKGIEGGVV